MGTRRLPSWKVVGIIKKIRQPDLELSLTAIARLYNVGLPSVIRVKDALVEKRFDYFNYLSDEEREHLGLSSPAPADAEKSQACG
jgi:hypothetical protein